MMPYALASHVFVCLQDEHVVFLDVRNDRYFALEAAKTRGLGALVRGWPVQSEEAASSVEDALESGLVEVLARRGLLTRSARSGKDATPIACVAPTEEIYAEDTGARPAIGFIAWSRFVLAAITASLALRFMPFERVIRQAYRRRVRARHAERLHPEHARELIAVFAWLRPYFFTSRDACLFEALALGRFLASYDIHPLWIFGVQARPFSAHCWLQYEGIVLNDTVEHVGQYTPIMVV